MERILPRESNRRIGRAMHTYNMLDDGDRVLVAVSGGVDSLVLAWVLNIWRRKAPIFYELIAVHIDMEPERESPGPTAAAVQCQLAKLQIPLDIIPAQWQPDPSWQNNSSSSRRDICFTCARHRRKQLFDYAGRSNYNKIAMGHHQDDIIETFFLNIVFGGNISTMVPRQDLFAGRLALIRPLSFLDKSDIKMIAESLEVTPVRTACPLSEQTRRLEIRQFLEHLYQKIPQAKRHIFAALSNVRHDYLLKATGEDQRRTEE